MLTIPARLARLIIVLVVTVFLLIAISLGFGNALSPYKQLFRTPPF